MLLLKPGIVRQIAGTQKQKQKQGIPPSDGETLLNAAANAAFWFEIPAEALAPPHTTFRRGMSVRAAES